MTNEELLSHVVAGLVESRLWNRAAIEARDQEIAELKARLDAATKAPEPKAPE